jgi:hypothetical protein
MEFGWHNVVSVIAGFTLVAPFWRSKANANDRVWNTELKTWSESRFDNPRYDYF